MAQIKLSESYLKWWQNHLRAEKCINDVTIANDRMLHFQHLTSVSSLFRCKAVNYSFGSERVQLPKMNLWEKDLR